jgi:hypothetical protein
VPQQLARVHLPLLALLQGRQVVQLVLLLAAKTH